MGQGGARDGEPCPGLTWDDFNARIGRWPARNGATVSGTSDLDLLKDADRRALAHVAGSAGRRVFPSEEALAGLAAFDEPLPPSGRSPGETLALLDEVGSPATVASTGPNYFGFVVGATFPVAAAADRMVTAWDQCASSFDGAPAAHALETTAARWVLDLLDLPRHSAVSFGTSASAGSLACLAAARRNLLARQGWDLDENGLVGAPRIRVVVPASVHVTIRKTLRVLGFGSRDVVEVPVDDQGRMLPALMPRLDDRTILCLQAGEVNTGSFDRFAEIIPPASAAGAWVHVDGAFGLWARVSERKRHLTRGLGNADSWTTDGHKWLNTPYDGAMAICRDRDALAGAMNSDAAYSRASADSQKNLGIDFSRRARGVPVWAALRSLGRDGVAALVDWHCHLAQRLARGLGAAGFTVLNELPLNQVLFRLDDDTRTLALRAAALDTGDLWFGQTLWQGRVALRMSVSSWQTDEIHVDRAVALMARLAAGAR